MPFKVHEYISVRCKQCKKVFRDRKEDIEAGKEFCSRSCYATYHNSKKGVHCISKIRDKARRVYIQHKGNPVCVQCSNPVADVHHKNEDIKDNRIENLEALCRSCHISHHNKTAPRRSKTDTDTDPLLTL